MGKGMTGHQSTKMIKDEWITPKWIIDDLGPFDLDPCSPVNPPYKIASKNYNIFDNGLNKKWNNRIWCNPPYGNEAKRWLNKLSNHGNGLALIFARTETKMFFDYIWNKADAIFFIKGRLSFLNIDGKVALNSSGAPSCIVAYGENNIKSLEKTKIPGILIFLNHKKNINCTSKQITIF